MQNKRTCGDCTVCCLGFPKAKVLRQITSPENPCFFIKKNCSIYDFRPNTCKLFECSWLAGILPEYYKPNIVKFIMYEISSSLCNFYKIIFFENNDEILLNLLNLLSEQYIIKYDSEWFIYGSKNFKNYIRNNKKLFLE